MTSATVIILALILILFAVLLGYIIWLVNRESDKKKKMQEGVREAEGALHKAFDMLKEDVSEQILMLKKAQTQRQLTEEEEKIIKQLRRDLSLAENFVMKEVEDVEKEISGDK
ncbi:MAG: hypothetical protein Q8P76_01210 [bacterium]|nr:hypothetical protein [bacterium]